MHWEPDGYFSPGIKLVSGVRVGEAEGAREPVTYRMARRLGSDVDEHVAPSVARGFVFIIGDPGGSLDVADWLVSKE